MDSFKDHLLEWGFFKKKEVPKQAASAPTQAATKSAPRTGFMSRNKSDPAHSLHRDLLQSEYRKHNDTPETNHTDATRKRRDELEKEVVRRGGKARERPEWHDAYLNRPKPKGIIHWKASKNI